MKKAIISILAVLVAIGAWTAYQNFSKPKSKTADEFKIAISSAIESYNPGQGSTADTSQVIAQVNDTLYAIDGDEVIPSGAEGQPEVSADKLVYKFKIKENYWVDSNGEKKGKVTAKDYVYGFQALADPANKSQYGTIAAEGNIKNAAEVNEGKKPVEELGVKALDDSTLQIELTTPTPYLTEFLGYNKFSPISVENVKAKGSLEAAFKTYKDVWYSGPYYMSEEKENESYKMTKNEFFAYKDTVSVKNVIVKLIKDPETMYKEFESGNLDQASITKKETITSRKNDSKVIYKKDGSIFYLALNQTSPTMQNINVRKTIQNGVDFTKIVEETLGTGSSGVNNLTPKGLTQSVYKQEYVDLLQKGRDYNLETAKQSAEKAKSELNGNVAFKLVAAESGNNKKMLEAIQAELNQNFGFNVTVEYIPSKEYFTKTRRDASSYDVMVSGWTGDYADPGTYLSILSTKNPALNFSRNTDENLTKMIEEGQKEGDVKARMEKLAKAENYAVTEQAYIVPFMQRGNYIDTNGKYTYKPNTLKVQQFRFLKVK